MTNPSLDADAQRVEHAQHAAHQAIGALHVAMDRRCTALASENERLRGELSDVDAEAVLLKAQVATLTAAAAPGPGRPLSFCGDDVRALARRRAAKIAEEINSNAQVGSSDREIAALLNMLAEVLSP